MPVILELIESDAFFLQDNEHIPNRISGCPVVPRSPVRWSHVLETKHTFRHPFLCLHRKTKSHSTSEDISLFLNTVELENCWKHYYFDFIDLKPQNEIMK